MIRDSTMSWILYAILVVGLVIGLLSWLFKPLKYRKEPAEKFEYYIRNFFKRLDDGGLIFITHEPTKKFVQYAKHVSARGSVLHYGFPDAPWSSSHFVSVYQALTQAGIEPRIQETEEGNVPRFIDVDIDAQDENAFSVAAQVACSTFDAMNVDTQSEVFTITWEGPLSRHAPGIEPDVERKALEKLQRHRLWFVRKWAQRRAEKLSKQVQ
jgi:hypothetical protein